jgi:hypothetical protein
VPKSSPAPVIRFPSPDLAAEADEFYAAWLARKAFAPTEARYQYLLKMRLDRCTDAAKPYSEKSARCEVFVSARGFDRTIPAKALHKALGLARFLQAVKTTLTGASVFLSADQVEAIAITTQTGSRTVKCLPILALPIEAPLPKAA